MKEEFQTTMTTVLKDKLEAAKAINMQQVEQVKIMALKLAELEKENQEQATTLDRERMEHKVEIEQLQAENTNLKVSINQETSLRKQKESNYLEELTAGKVMSKEVEKIREASLEMELSFVKKIETLERQLSSEKE